MRSYITQVQRRGRGKDTLMIHHLHAYIFIVLPIPDRTAYRWKKARRTRDNQVAIKLLVSGLLT